MTAVNPTFVLDSGHCGTLMLAALGPESVFFKLQPVELVC